VVDTFQIGLMMVEVIIELIHIRPDDVPSFLKKEAVKAIWPRGFIIREI
jgi:hypothetical protein